uniref:MHD domain-containing protein n=2 Tax=Hemiselmis andersenii TaxID=464988 RepID=A0A7S0UEJ2_HEMAN
MTSAAANKPIQVSGDKKDNTIFVDVIERLTVVLDSRGSMTHSYINGCITLKSFMTGSSEMRLGLSDGVSVTSLGISGKGASAVNTLVMEDMNLHECVRWDENKKEAVFTFFAPDGEFNLLSYRIKSPFRAPISVVPFLETKPRANSLDYVLRVRGEFPADKTAAHVSLVFALPHWANSVAVETASATAAAQGGDKGAVPVAGKAQFDRKTQVVHWQIAKIQGGTEVIVRCKIVLASNMDATACSLEDFGVVRVNFELPMHLLSGVSIKFLDFLYASGKTPNKWIRYVTQANSYVARWS